MKQSFRLVVGFFPKAEYAEEALLNIHRERLGRAGLIVRTPEGDFQASGLSHLPAKSVTFYRMTLLPGESVVVVKTPTGRVREALSVLGRPEPAATFVFHPQAETLENQDCIVEREPISPENLRILAGELASRHKPRPPAGRKSQDLLKILAADEQALETIISDLREVYRLERSSSGGAERLVDNLYIVRSHIADIRRNLQKRYREEVPSLENSREGRFVLRVYELARELICHTDLRLQRQVIVDFLEAYQTVAPLTIAELWMFPLMLRIAIVSELHQLAARIHYSQLQHDTARFWANRLVAAGRHDNAAAMLEALARLQQNIDPHFMARLTEQLRDEENPLVLVQEWMEAKAGSSLAEILQADRRRQAADHISIANAIGSLRLLAQIDFLEVFESVSPVDTLLRNDPDQIYVKSSFTTRDRCRRAIEKVARHSKRSESEVAQFAVNLATRSQSYQGNVGYYLLDAGLPVLESEVKYRTPLSDRLLRALRRHAAFAYLGSIFLLTVGLTYPFVAITRDQGVHPVLVAILALLAILPISELALQIVQASVAALLPPRVVPRMSFDEGIPAEATTLVVIPMMLTTPAAIRSEAEKLEIRYLANREEHLHFSLLSDFCDADTKEIPADSSLLQAAMQAIEELNSLYGDRFVLFHRERVWSESEQKWIGWERKRGKLEELNAFLNGEQIEDARFQVLTGKLPGAIKYVITLDADTQLPSGTARQLIGTASHPLNCPELTPDGRHLVRGFTIIQPRASIPLPGSMATRFTRLFTDTTGSDPYCQAVSDIYQDLFGQGTFFGKGLYDVEAMHRLLKNRFPEETLVSHDLIEGNYVGVALASDVELFENFPHDYQSYSRRQHRWTRGDWQILKWMLRSVPSPGGGREPNPLAPIDRWKIFDNLRRSLVGCASVLLLLIGWVSEAAPELWSIVAAAPILMPAFLAFFRRVMGTLRGELHSWRESHKEWLRAIATIALLPHQAWITTDAIVRALYRSWVSKRHLLEWETAEMSHLSSARHLSSYLIQSLFIFAGTSILFVILIFRGLAWHNVIYLSLWLLSPGVIWWLGRPDRRRRAILPERQHLSLRRIARETWRYFDDHVGPQTNWLPPDNAQMALRVEVAQRTSPTNIGFWMMSALAARDLGYITPDQLIERISATLSTMDRLNHYEGHLMNWYDIQTLEPLIPRYVSTVDSGNLLASLWTLDQGLQEMISSPVISHSCLHGLNDTLAIADYYLPAGSTAINLPMKTLRNLFGQANGITSTISSLRLSAAPILHLVEALRWIAAKEEEPAYWVKSLESQHHSWSGIVDRYLLWLELLAEPPDEFLLSLDPSACEIRRRIFRERPSLLTLAEGSLPSMDRLLNLGTPAENLTIEHAAWLAGLQEKFQQARTAAAETVAKVRALSAKIEEISSATNLRFLYDPTRRLFHIGYGVDSPQLDPVHYDLFASESSLTSFLAIAKGDAPIEHWLALGRPYVSSTGGLLSWSGSMFEYLMPLLFTRSFDHSLTEHARHQAVARQIDYGRECSVPWGISESAFSALDSKQIYQYRAFGVPSLGLRRTDPDENLVVSPYSTMLALMVDPNSALDNLRDLEQEGLYGPMGFYEAIDYTRQRTRSGKSGVIVYTYMSHHQGMSMIALDNVLHRGVMQKRFHSDLRVRAVEPLLYERIPSIRSQLEPAPERDWMAIATEAAEPVSRRMRENTVIPRAHLLGHESYSLMITNSGGGYSRWRDCDITRWRADTTRDQWGSYCFIRDLRSGAGWSATFHPLAVEDPSYTATFSADRVEFARRQAGIDSLLEVTVAPEDDAEIRRLTLTNRTLRTRSLDVVSYMELAMAPHGHDRAHPVFSKLFVQTGGVPELSALLAWRRPNSPGAPPIWTAHFAVGVGPDNVPDFDTDRAAFLGRSRDARNTRGWQERASNSRGTVLDPIFSLRHEVSIEPRKQIRVTFVTVAGESREAVIRLIEKYRSAEACDRVFELAWTHAQLEFRYLGIEAETAHRFQELASHMLYPNARLRTAEDRLRRNQRGLSSLWAHGISGDLPIAVVTIADYRGIPLVREMLLAHTYWRLRGFRADLVILNQEFDSYEQPLNDQLVKLIQAHSVQTGVDKPGGVFLRKWRSFPQYDLDALLSAARVSLGATRGLIAQQLGRPLEPPQLVYPLVPTASEDIDTSPGLPFLELDYFNGLGGFSKDGKEYCTYLGPGAVTPLPWINVIANPEFGTLVSESGSGFTWNGNSQANRLTQWHNDPVSDPCTDAIYIRDEETGSVWSPTALPIREKTAYRARHGQGSTMFEHNSHGIEQVLVTFVPMKENGGDPVSIQRLRLKNSSNRTRRLTVTRYLEWALDANREESQSHLITEWDAESGSLLARNSFHPQYPNHVAFAAIRPRATSFAADRTSFLGRNGSLERPAAMRLLHLSGRTGAGLDPCAALQTSVVLEPGQEKEVLTLLGQTTSLSEVRQLIARHENPEAVENTLAETRHSWDDLLGTIQVKTPVRSVDLLINRWMLYQTLTCRIWARSALYQSGGGFGFRDQLQDVLALLYCAPQLARQHILRAAGRQFVEGDVQHWWHQPGGAGIRTRCSDDLLWLPYATSQYIEVTGDSSILDEVIPFIDGPLLKEHEHESYFVPSDSAQSASLNEHCRRAIERGSTSGPHGLPLIGSGDWNDGMNLIGVEGRGESVWLAWFLMDVLGRFARVSEARGESTLAQDWRQRAERIEEAIAASAWDGDWYRRAYFDDGTPLGSQENSEARIDILPQAWSVLSGARNRNRSSRAMRSVEQHLVRRKEKQVLVLTPPFDHFTPSPGYIEGYPPGLRENGGQYTHAALWGAMAFARMGDGARATEILQMLNPIEHARNPQEVAQYRVEPYVIAADVYSYEGGAGRGGWTWYTGSASWMYRIWLEEILGFHLRGNELSIRPVLPDDWNEFDLSYRRGQTTYEIHVEKSTSLPASQQTVELDGVPLAESFITLSDDGARHVVRVLTGVERKAGGALDSLDPLDPMTGDAQSIGSTGRGTEFFTLHRLASAGGD